MPSQKRGIRIAGCSGGFTDRQRSILSMARCDVDVIIGDWMSECTMGWHGAAKSEIKKKGTPDAERAGLFDPSFMDTFSPALDLIEQKGIKVAVNAGASDTEMLAKLVENTCKDKGHKLRVAWVEGDDVMDTVNKLLKTGRHKFENTCFGGNLEDWGFEPVAAQCYLGGAGIAEAFRQGADIVICGRVSDAAPVIGAAMHYHGWNRDKDFDQIAGSLMAGHLIECSSYVCGGYYSGFKRLFEGCENLGFPIATIYEDGSFHVTKEPGTGGEVSVGTCASQLLYEIQGPQYYGSDVVAVLDDLEMYQEDKDKVYVCGIKGNPPPTTTRVGITAVGGYQAEFHYYVVGLDLEQKLEWTKKQILYSMGPENEKKFSRLEFQLVGYGQPDPEDQMVATADIRIFAQTKDRSLVVRDSIEVPGFNRWCLENFLQSCPGATIKNDIRESAGKEFFEYWAALIPQDVVQHKIQLLWSSQTIDIAPSSAIKVYEDDKRQWSYETTNPVDLKSFGPTIRGPLGWRVLGRSGDKASHANVGLFVEHDDEWDWLRSFMTVAKMKELLGKEYNGKLVERFEIKHIRAVHFLLHDHLDRSYNASSTLDGLGKNVCEYLRAKYVDLPTKFLRRGTI